MTCFIAMIRFIVLFVTCQAFAKNSCESNQNKGNEEVKSNEVAFIFGGLNKNEAKKVEVFNPGSQNCRKSIECIPQLPLALVDAVGIFDGRHQRKESCETNNSLISDTDGLLVCGGSYGIWSNINVNCFALRPGAKEWISKSGSLLQGGAILSPTPLNDRKYWAIGKNISSYLN